MNPANISNVGTQLLTTQANTTSPATLTLSMGGLTGYFTNVMKYDYLAQYPATNNTIDLGTSSLKFKDVYANRIKGVAYDSTPVHISYCNTSGAITTTPTYFPRSGTSGSANAILIFFKTTVLSEISVALGYIPTTSQSYGIYKNDVYQTAFSVAIADWTNPGGRRWLYLEK